jgi:DNA-binding MarR family transcriptional regulator
MPRRMVDAFKMEIEEDKEAPKGPREPITETITMNPRRQEILSFLCRYPCSRLSKIAKELELSNAATKWHLARLAEKDFITSQDMGNTKVFYPIDMIEKGDVNIFACMNHERAIPILRRILSNSGITQKALCQDVQLNQRTVVRHTNELENVGLINIIQDGKFRRYYPTQLIEKMRVDYRKRVKRFRKHLLKKLKDDGVNPKVMRATDFSLHVRITAGEKKNLLELGTQPFSSVLEPYKGL